MGEGRGCCSSLMRSILTIINVLTVLSGIVILAVAIFLYFKQSDYFPDLENYDISLNGVSIALIVLGGLLTIIGIFGCIGALTGNRGLLNFYFIFLLIISLLEIAVIIYGYISKDDVDEQIDLAFNDIFAKFNSGTANNPEMVAVTTLQTTLECCGFDGPDFWTNSTMFGGDKVPGSCCSGYDITSSNVAALCQKVDAYMVGCKGDADTLIANFTLTVLIVLLICLAFQLFCMIVACYVKNRDDVV